MGYKLDYKILIFSVGIKLKDSELMNSAKKLFRVHVYMDILINFRI